MAIYSKGKTKRGLPRWLIVVHHKGMRKAFVVRGMKADATAFEARKQIELEQADPTDPRVVPSFSTFCHERYIPFAQRELGAQTWSHRRYQLATLLEFFGSFRLNDVANPRHIARFQNLRRDEGIGATTINDDIKVLRAILGYAAEQNFRFTIPKIRRLKEVRTRGLIVPWTEEQIQLLFSALSVECPPLLALAIFLINTGCRKTEAIRLRSRSVDLKSGTVRIEPNLEWTPKDNEARVVPISVALRPILESRLRREFVFLGDEGEPWRYWPQHAFDRARDAAVAKDVRKTHDQEHEGEIRKCAECAKYLLWGGPHMLRHTYASRFLAAQGDMFTLAKILGHSHERTTALYAHLMPGAVQRAAALVSVSPQSTEPLPQSTEPSS